MKAIETRYKGYRFRSRLEARWAVFFDAIGVKWEYEPEGYKFDNNDLLPYPVGHGKSIYYLPDFYLPEEDVWVEVKPNRPGKISELEENKIVGFARHYPIVVVRGEPKDGSYLFITWLDVNNEEIQFFLKFGLEEELQKLYGEFGVTHDDLPCIGYGKWIFGWYRVYKFLEKWIEKYKSEILSGDWSKIPSTHLHEKLDSALGNACMKATQARFEHGEAG